MSSSSSGPPNPAYFITLRPYLEIFSVNQNTMPLTRSVVSGPGATLEGDLIGLASAASAEAMQLARRWQGGASVGQGSNCRTMSSLMLLLTAGGVCYYLIYRKSDEEEEPEERPRV